MVDCEHNAEGGGEPWAYVCRLCGAIICTDCGSTPAHEDSPCGYCRRCSEKGGHRYAFKTEIDHDLLRAKVGRELAEQILNVCKAE